MVLVQKALDKEEPHTEDDQCVLPTDPTLSAGGNGGAGHQCFPLRKGCVFCIGRREEGVIGILGQKQLALTEDPRFQSFLPLQWDHVTCSGLRLLADVTWINFRVTQVRTATLFRPLSPR